MDLVPTKELIVPRLELMSRLLLSCLLVSVKKALSVEVAIAKVVRFNIFQYLYWFNIFSKTWKNIEVDCWRDGPTDCTPIDIATRVKPALHYPFCNLLISKTRT